MKTAEISQLHASYSFLDKVVDMPIVFNDECPYLSVQTTAKVPQLQRSFKVADVPVVQVVMVPQVLSAVVNVPVIIQRQVRVSSTVEVPQIQFTGRVVDIAVQVPQVQVVILTRFPSSWCRSWRRQSRFHSCHVTRKTSR